MMKKDLQIEADICKIYDLLAEDQDAKAQKAIYLIIEELKARTQVEFTDNLFPEQSAYFLQWGRCLELLDEPEQALLKWEKSLNFEPQSIETLWAMASCLIYTMNKPEIAIPLLKDRLIPLDEHNEQFIDALKASELGAMASEDFPDFLIPPANIGEGDKFDGTINSENTNSEQ